MSGKGKIVVGAVRLRVPEDVVFEVLDGQAVLLHLKSGTYFSLNSVGTRFWELVEKHGEFTKIREEMLRIYDVEPSVLDDDLGELMTRLRENGLITTE